MARLEFSNRELTVEGHAPAVVVNLVGSVDPETLEPFEAMMDALVEGGQNRIIFNLEKLKYINSTGMGMSVQFADQLNESGGGLAFMRVPPKVLLVIEMLGLQELFQIVGNEEQALAALDGDGAAPDSGEQTTDPAPAPEAPAPEPPAPEAAAEEDTGTAVAEEARFGPGGEPQVMACPACGAQLSLPGEGAYSCPRCRCALELNAEGELQAYPEDLGNVAELSLPAEEDFFSGAGWMINLAGLRGGLSEEKAQAAAEATQGCLKLLAEQALGGPGENERIHLFIAGASNHLCVRIYCSGQALTGQDAVEPFRTGVERLQYMASPEGNLITIEQS